MKLQTAVVATGLLLTIGCASTNPSLYSDAGDAFSKGYTAASEAVAKTAALAPHTQRIQFVQNTFVGNPTLKDETVKRFAQFVCVGGNALAEQRAALSVLSAYQAHIKDLTATPPDDVWKIWASIKESSAPGKPLALKTPGQDNSCLDEVAFLSTATAKGVGELGVTEALVLYKALSGLVDALKAAAIEVGHIVDDAARARALKAYIDNNAAFINEVLDRRLGPTDSAIEKLCHGVSAAPCNEFTAERPPTVLDGVYIRAKWASLRAPLYAFNHLVAQSPGMRKRKDFAAILALGEDADRGAVEFLELRRRPSPSNIVAAMKQAQRTLERVASGEITAAEGWVALKAFATRAKGVKDAIDGVSEGYEGVTAELLP